MGRKWAKKGELVPLNKCSIEGALYAVMKLIDHVIEQEKRISELEEQVKKIEQK